MILSSLLWLKVTALTGLLTLMTIGLSPFATPALAKENTTANGAASLPAQVRRAVLQNLAQRSGRPIEQFRVMRTMRQSWPNGCLGLPAPDEICTQAIVPGWYVVATDGQQVWNYRTDEAGRVVRLESTREVGQLPGSIAQQVRRQAAQYWKVGLGRVRIMQAERRTWPDGCLGLPDPGTLCTQALVEGWQVVVVEAKGRHLTYRTDASGQVIRRVP